jgi:hypothetical protein
MPEVTSIGSDHAGVELKARRVAALCSPAAQPPGRNIDEEQE